MSLTTLPQIEGFAGYLTAIPLVDASQTIELLQPARGVQETEPFPALECLKSLDDLDEEEDEDDDDDDDDDDDLGDEEDEDDLDEDYDEDEDDEDEDEDEDDEDEDEDGGVKPLKMS